jgi:rsbT co-antagonist protein RsbR
MAQETPVRASVFLREHENEILEDWVRQQSSVTGLRAGRLDPADLRRESANFIDALSRAVAGGTTPDMASPTWADVRDVLGEISRSRARLGFNTAETAVFVMSLKRSVFTRLRTSLEGQPLADAIWEFTELLDALALWTTEAYQKSREDIIARQQQEMLELSTPVVELWEGILALPLIGTLDSSRTQIVMENLLEKIVETGASLAIIDITGVATVDTLVAQHLLKTVAAARLMGADCIISGIRPQIAQTIIHLGVDLGGVSTKASLAGAFNVALQRRGLRVGPRE